MKKLFTLIFVASILIGLSQSPNTFGDPNATCNIASTYPDANPQNPDFADMYGKMLMKENFSREGTVEINTASLENSIYISEIECENKTVRQKFMKK
ncbi:MAG: hypothetical protein ACLFPE_04015 [Bacteroidales bacterium]